MVEPYALELCVDCVTADANGPNAEGISPDWSGFMPEWSGWIMGTAVWDYDEPRGPFFSSYPCEGCGSGLAGDRFYYAAVPR